MDCRMYLEQIAAHVDNALGADDASMAREHLAGCPECSAKYRWESALRGTLKGKLPPREPSPFLRQRIIARLADARPPMRLWQFTFPLKIVAGVAIFLLLLLPSYLLREGSEQPHLFSSVVTSYREVKHGVGGEAVSPHTSAMLLDLSPWGYRLLSKRMETVDGRPAQVSVYEGADRTYLMAQEFEDSSVSIPEEARVVDDGANSFFTYEREGVNLVAWRERGILCVITSSLSESDLLALAKRIAVRG